jgi:hypothetical protein
MKHYRLVIYWWGGSSGSDRQVGEEYQFEAPDDVAAAVRAQSDFDEPISLADQSAVINEIGHVVWKNEPPER